MLCEQEVEKGFPTTKSGLIVRPGLIVGPHDYTNRFPYYVRRIGEVGICGRGGEAYHFPSWVHLRLFVSCDGV